MSETPVKKQALLIGINDYEILPKLKYARQDAEAVEQSLKYNYCFTDNEIMLLTDVRSGEFKPLNRRIIEKQLKNLANQELDLLIFGFWGHGVVRNGRRYLCPLDVMPDEVEELGVPFDDLMNMLTSIRAKNTCLILDCCQRVHDGERSEEETFTAADQSAIENAARDIVYNRQKKEPEFQSNVAILNSCKQGQAAYEWDNRKHGIFTAHLLDAMNRRFETVSQIVSYVSQNVETTAKELGKKQTPLCSLEGDIHLPVDTKTTPLVTGDVFVSYRHSNEKLVAPIEEELKKRGISYFIDHAGISYTMEYASAIAQAVKECKVLLFVWTQDADVSPDILREVSMAVAYNKRVLPYKIGTFDVKEHSSLFYQLSPISRYEVPKQTPETVIELVNQVQRAMTDETYQQYSFNIPVNSADAVIVKPEIGNIDITISSKVIEKQKPIQTGHIKLPPKSEDLLRIQAENKWLHDAIEQLKTFTHESLSQANIAFQQTKAQLELWGKRRKERWEDLPKNIRESWEQTIVNNPDCTEKDIDLRKTWEEILADNSYSSGISKNQLYFDLLEKFHCGKKFQQAKLELERVEQERKSKCEEVIERFQKQIEDNEHRYNDCLNIFFDDVLLKILSSMPGYNDINTPFPSNEVVIPLRQLDKYELGWEAPNEIDRARELWGKKRPCVISQQEKLEQKRKWKGLVIKLIFTFLFLIGFSLLFLCGSLFNDTSNTSEHRYQLFYLFGSSASCIIGLPLCVSAVLLWIGFNLNDTIRIIIRGLYLLAAITLFSLGVMSYNTFWGGDSIRTFLFLSGFFLGLSLISFWILSHNCDKESRLSVRVILTALSVIPLVAGGLSLLFDRVIDSFVLEFIACFSVVLGLLLTFITFTKYTGDLGD